MRYTISIVFLFFSLNTFAQRLSSTDDTTTTFFYRIDSALKSEVDSEVLRWDAIRKDSQRLDGMMKWEIFLDNRMLKVSDKNSYVPYKFRLVKVDEQDSSISIIASREAKKTGLGFEIDIKKTHCVVTFVAVSGNGKVFKNFKKEKEYKDNIHVPTQYHLTLVKAPTFKKGEIIEGLVELRGYDYYEKLLNDDAKMNINIVAYFRTKPISENN